jgi:CubicO group peptidase (beta-lactamase class C family)
MSNAVVAPPAAADDAVPITARSRRATIAVATLLALSVAVIGTVARPVPPSLSTKVTGDSALAAMALPYLDGALDRVSIAVVDGGTVAYANFGAESDTVYEIGSVTKTFTSLLLADAIERGDVTAETTLGAILPGLAGAPAADVTLAELASHRSGLPRTAPLSFFQELLFLRSPNHDPFVQDVDEVIAQARTVTLSQRGTVSYSNLGTALLGQALAANSSMTYEELVRQRIFGPLGMSRSTLPITVENLPSDVLTGYSADGKHAPAWTLYGSAPGGGIHSTAEDLVRYAQALLDGTAPGMVALTPRWDAGYGTRIGYAWNTTTVAGHTVTSHGGATGGFCSAIALDLANDRAVIILSSTKAPVEQAAQTLLVGEH